MNLREAAQQALEALEVWRDCLTDPRAKTGWRFAVVGEKAMNTLRAALAEDAMQRLTDVHQEIEATSQESQQVETVGEVTEAFGGAFKCEFCKYLPVGTKLYTAPPKREPLTEESLENLFLGNDSNDWWRLELKEFVKVARAIERAHGIGSEE